MSQSPQTADSAGIRLPARVIVSLRAGAILAVANILCAGIIAFAYTKSKAEVKVINVTGSAKKAIKSDLIVWHFDVSATSPEIATAYDQLNAGVRKTLDYLREKKIADADTKTSSIRTSKHFVKNERGQETDKISEFQLDQTVEVSGADVEKVQDVERGITVLLKDGVMLESSPPKYLYTRIADLKIAMLAEATKDASTRAQQIAVNSGATLGPIREARMGVMQVNAMHHDDATGSGVNDTSSYDKEITAVVSARFELK